MPVSTSLRLIVVLNETLFDVIGDDVTQEQAFAHANGGNGQASNGAMQPSDEGLNNSSV